MIQINEKLRIRKTDEKNLELEEYRKCIDPKTKEECFKWKWLGYYGDLKSALLGALNKKLFDSAEEEIALKEVVGKIDAARRSILNALNEKEERM